MTSMPMTRAHAPTPPMTGRSRARHHWWRWVAGVLAGLLVVFVGAAWYFSGRIESQALASNPTSFPPAYDDVKVVDLTEGTLSLVRGSDAGPSFDAAAHYGLAWEGGTGLVGPATLRLDGTATRALQSVTSGTEPVAGQMAAIDRARWLGDPAVAYGTDPTDVVVPGGFPAWLFPAENDSGDVMAIVVHGQNGSRADGLRVVDALHGVGMPALVITYRNDLGAPSDPSGRLQFGVTEWQDLDAAVTWARDQGVTDVVLVGQSMGGAVVASFLENSDQADVVSRVVLDAPMLSLGETVAYGARDAMPVVGGPVPEPVIWGAQMLAALRFGVDWSAVDYLDDTSWLQVPTLVVHGTADPTVPAVLSEQLASAEPELVTLETFPGALHVEAWNADPPRYADVVQSFLGSD